MKNLNRQLLMRLSATGVILLCCGVIGIGQTTRHCGATTQAPCIDKIDPPDWWVGMPDPMLLVHGSGLAGAHFAVRGKRVSLQHTQVSANGHWAFLWLGTAHASQQTLEISAGDAHASYNLGARSRNPHAHAGFSAKDVMYLIMPDRFARGSTAPPPSSDDRTAPRGWHGGDLAGIEQHLDYLKQLGVTTVWTTPVASNAGMADSYHGYAATDLYAVDPHLGTLADYRRLSNALHARGMKLVIDLVPNHIGLKHPWVADPPAPDWLHGSVAHHRALDYKFYDLLDPHAPPAAWRGNTDGWFSDYMPDLNQENPLVSRYLIENALWWVETANLDGIRLDTFPYVSRAFWHDFHAALHREFPHLTTVGEIYHRDPEVTSFFAGGVARDGAEGDIDTGLDTPFDYPLCFALRDVLTQDKPMTELTDILRQDALYPHPERLVTFFGNHDLPRFLTEARGSVAMLKMGVGLLATLRGMPELYTGDEIGMTGGPDPDNRHDFPGGFPGDPHNAFTAAGRTPTQEEIFRWTSGLLAYRAAHEELKTGIEQNIYSDANSFVFVRGADAAGCDSQGGSERLLIVANKSEQEQSLDLPVSNTALAGCTSFEAAPITPGEQPQLSDGKLRIEEPAKSMTIYTVR
jgi:neopullulanase